MPFKRYNGFKYSLFDSKDICQMEGSQIIRD